jgi:hypothetical protein
MLLRTDLKETMVPHHTKVRELIIWTWRMQFQVLKQELAVISHRPIICLLLTMYIQNAIGHVLFTTDLWSNQNRKSYLALTAHWIARVDDMASLQLKMSLIGFHHLHGGHDGKLVAKAIIGLLDRAGVMVMVKYPCCLG